MSLIGWGRRQGRQEQRLVTSHRSVNGRVARFEQLEQRALLDGGAFCTDIADALAGAGFAGSWEAPPNHPGTPLVDISAVESLPANSELPGSKDIIIVSTAADENDGDFAAGDLSLRETLSLAGARPGEDIIQFDPSLNGRTITLALGQLEVDTNVRNRSHPGAQFSIN